jgi:hypothetical protein
LAHAIEQTRRSFASVAACKIEFSAKANAVHNLRRAAIQKLRKVQLCSGGTRNQTIKSSRQCGIRRFWFILSLLCRIAAYSNVSERDVWHLTVNGQQMGPLTEKEISDGILSGLHSAQTLVWREGWTQWQPISNTELARYFNTPAPVENYYKKVSLGFGIGILLVPYIFSWFILRKGFSNVARIVTFSWLAVWFSIISHSSKQDVKPSTSTTNGVPVCEVGIFAEKIDVKNGTASKRETINPLSSAELLASGMLNNAWEIATSCPEATTLNYTLVQADLVDRYGNQVPDVEAVISLDLTDARKYKDSIMYSQDDIIRALTIVQIQRSAVGRFFNN